MGKESRVYPKEEQAGTSECGRSLKRNRESGNVRGTSIIKQERGGKS